MPTRKKNGEKTKPEAATLEVTDFTPDLEGCEKGRWKEHPEAPGASFLIASTSHNPEWDAAYFDAARAIRERCKDRDIDPDSREAAPVQRHEVGKAIARALLLDWKGVTKQGEPFEPTLENRIWFAEHVRWVTNWVIQQAGERGNFRAEALEQDSGN